MTTQPVQPMTVDRYHALIEAGAFDGHQRTERLAGMLVEGLPVTPSHHIATYMVRETLAAVHPTGCLTDTGPPITMADSEPEPDVAVIRGASADYAERHPGPQDVALVVEVADSSLSRDRGLKLRIYARAAIPVYWILNLQTRALEIYTNPQGDEYATRVTLREAETAPLPIGPATVTVPVARLLPPAANEPLHLNSCVDLPPFSAFSRFFPLLNPRSPSRPT